MCALWGGLQRFIIKLSDKLILQLMISSLSMDVLENDKNSSIPLNIVSNYSFNEESFHNSENLSQKSFGYTVPNFYLEQLLSQDMNMC